MSTLSRLLLLIVLAALLASYNRVFAAEPTHSTHAGRMPSHTAAALNGAAVPLSGSAGRTVETAEEAAPPALDNAKPAPFWLGFRLPEAMFNGCLRSEE